MMQKNKFLGFVFFIGLLVLHLPHTFAETIPPWVRDLPIPQQKNLYIVIKGIYDSPETAQKTQKLVAQLMGTTPPDQIDRSENYRGLPAKKYILGTLFDSEKRARWWADFSYRNTTIAKGKIQIVQVQAPSQLPYYPENLQTEVKLLTEDEALERVQKLPDVQILAQQKTLKYKITDYPRNGDLRYEVEILEIKPAKKDPVMVDFLMVNALDGSITERLSTSLNGK